MLNTAKRLNGYKLEALDEEIGTVKEFYFDDRYWTIRYLVADTGNWLTGRHVLISPYALIDMKKETQRISVNLSKKQIEESPSLESDKPVSKQFEESYHEYYGWPMYWSGLYMWGSLPYIIRFNNILIESTQNKYTWDPDLRSTHEVSGYHVHAKDGDIGHVDDFIIDDETWAIRYLIIDTKNWLPGLNVLISPKWIERVSWDKSKVYVNLSRDAIKNSPPYTETSLITRNYENDLHKHYNHEGYWVDDPIDAGINAR